MLELEHDVYLGNCVAAVLALTCAYTTATSADWRAILMRNWKASLLLGVVFGFVLVRNVLTEDAKPHPHGAYYGFELVWRGGIDGAIDALLLTISPCTMVHRAVGWAASDVGHALGVLRRVGCAERDDHRDLPPWLCAVPPGRAAPARDLQHDHLVPMLLTANPIGSVDSHAAMHVSAAAHIYETDVRLPPAVKAD